VDTNTISSFYDTFTIASGSILWPQGHAWFIQGLKCIERKDDIENVSTSWWCPNCEWEKVVESCFLIETRWSAWYNWCPPTTLQLLCTRAHRPITLIASERREQQELSTVLQPAAKLLNAISSMNTVLLSMCCLIHITTYVLDIAKYECVSSPYVY